MPSAPTVLVAEDEYASLEVLALMLTAKGYSVLTASDGEEALKLARLHPVDLLITDYMMPRMNGATLCLELARDARLAQIPVIMMSANHPDDIPPLPRLVAFFGKPLLFDKLLTTVRRILGSPDLPLPER